MEDLLEQAAMGPDSDMAGNKSDSADNVEDIAIPSQSPRPGQNALNMNSVNTIFRDSAPFMDISITRFYPKERNMVYEISTWEDGSGKSHVVERTYDDFEWLYDRLLSEDQLSGCAIQPLPPVVYWYPEDEKQYEMLNQTMQQQGIGVHVIAQDPIQKRAAQLERWLRRLTGLSELRQDLHLRTFCLFQDQIGVQPRGLWHDLTSLFGSVKGELTINQKAFKTNCKNLVQPAVSELCQRLTLRTRSINELALNYYNVAQEFNLATIGTSESLQQYQGYVANALRKSAHIQVQTAASMDTSLEVLLSEQLCAMQALVMAYDRTASLQARYERAEMDASKVPPEQADDAKAKLDRMQSVVTSVKSSLETSEKTFKLARVTEYKQCLTVYAVTQMELAVAELQMWTQVKHDLSVIGWEDEHVDNYEEADSGHDNDRARLGVDSTLSAPTEAVPGSPFRGGEVISF